MAGIWKVFMHDLKSAAKSPLTLVIILGLAVMPAFYSWLNIEGSWDPYGNTKNIKVALATSDEGYSSELLPMQINLGERVIDNLLESDSIGYDYVSEDEAKEGVRRGDYYAAIVLPKDFSRQMLSVLSGDPSQADIYYYDNQKRNAIAQIVTDKASDAVKREIEESFTNSLITVGASALADVDNFMSDAQIESFAANLATRLDQLQKTLDQSQNNISHYVELIDASSNLLTTSRQNLADRLQKQSDLSSILSGVQDPLNSLNTSLGSNMDSIQGSLNSEASSLKDVRSAIEKALSASNAQVDDVVSGLSDANNLLVARIDRLQEIDDSLQSTISKIDAASANSSSDIEKAALDAASSSLKSIESQIASAKDEAESLSDSLTSTIDKLNAAEETASSAKDEVMQKLSAAEDKLTAANTAYKEGLGKALGDISSSLSEANATANSLTSQLDSTSKSINNSMDALSSDMGNFASGLKNTAATLGETNNKISDLRDRLNAALASGDVERIKTILNAGVTPLADFLASPVTINKESLFPVANNGSAMTPYYSTMSIWVGGTLMSCVMIAKLSKKSQKELEVNNTQAYLGRLLFFMLINAIQSLIVCFGDLYYLGVQSVNPLAFVLTGVLAGAVFINIIYALAVSFGDVGKAIAVLIMVIQVAGSGGTFPPEMLPSFFQKLYPYLPFVHAETLFRAAIAGAYGNEMVVEALRLAAFLIPALALGLILRRPLIRFNEYIEERLEGTKLM